MPLRTAVTPTLNYCNTVNLKRPISHVLYFSFCREAEKKRQQSNVPGESEIQPCSFGCLSKSSGHRQLYTFPSGQASRSVALVIA